MGLQREVLAICRTPEVTFDDQGKAIFTQTGKDQLVTAYVKNQKGFIDEALESALQLLEDGDEAIRAARVQELQGALAGIVDETARGLGLKISQRIETYAVLQFELEYENQMYQTLQSMVELN